MNMKHKLIQNTFFFLFAFSIVISDSSHGGTNESINTDSLTLNSLRKLDGSQFYTMNYYSDYNFKEYLDGRIEFPILDSTDKNLRIKCTCFAAMGNSDSMFFGRNFDYSNSIPLLLFTYPKDGLRICFND